MSVTFSTGTTCVHFEPQLGEDEDGFWLTLTISHLGHYMTTGPFRLGTDRTAAQREAARQVSALIMALRGTLWITASLP